MYVKFAEVETNLLNQYQQGSRGPGGKGPGPLKIQWGPCEILPEGPMDPPKIQELVMYFNGWTLQILLRALGNSNGGGPGPSTKNVYWEPWPISVSIPVTKICNSIFPILSMEVLILAK